LVQEATRVNTPPLKEDVADGRPRGLFFDVTGPSASDQPQTGSDSASSAGPNATPTPRARQDDEDPFDQRAAARQREWWDIPSKSTAAAAASKRNQLRKSVLFEFNLPEHLPTSPMCPANPKNASSGKGVCVVSFWLLTVPGERRNNPADAGEPWSRRPSSDRVFHDTEIA
jgi:parafibromin